jgi:hypothetical protein
LKSFKGVGEKISLWQTKTLKYDQKGAMSQISELQVSI